MLHADFTALSSVEPEFLPINVLRCGNMIFVHVYEPDTYPLKTYSQTKSELSTSRFSQVIVLQTDSHKYRQMPAKKHYHATSRIWTVTCSQDVECVVACDAPPGPHTGRGGGTVYRRLLTTRTCFSEDSRV